MKSVNLRSFTYALVLLCTLPSRGFALVCYDNFSKGEFPLCRMLSPTLALHWKVEGANITFALAAQTTGLWIGIGLSPSGSMLSSDLWVVQRASANSSWVARDYYASDYTNPPLDESQDVVLLAQPTQIEGVTLAVIRRPLLTADDMDLAINTEGRPQMMIWAFSRGPWPVMHYTSGIASLILVPSESSPSSPAPASPSPSPMPAMSSSPSDAMTDGPVIPDFMPNDTFTVDLRMPNYTIPPEEVTWRCVNLPVPSDATYYIIAYQPLNTNNLLHHMLLLSCSSTPPLGSTYECVVMVEPCATVSFIKYAPDFDRVDLPSDMGMAIGAGDVIPKHFALQLHYLNPELKTGVVDDTGVRLYLTKQPRKDLGTLTLGQPPPPQKPISRSSSPPTSSTPPSLCSGRRCKGKQSASPSPSPPTNKKKNPMPMP